MASFGGSVGGSLGADRLTRIFLRPQLTRISDRSGVITGEANSLASTLARAGARIGAFARRPDVAGLLKLIPPALGLLMIGLLVVQVRAIGWATIARVWPSSPWFYALFTASYIGPILTEIVIYHRLWHVGLSSAPFFLRKRVMNEALLGYSGEAYAVWWAKAHATGPYTPLQVVKDVNILSGIVSNLGTLALCAVTLLLADGVKLASAASTSRGPALLGAMAFLLAVTFFLLLRPKLFSLPKRTRAFIAAMHALRLVTGVMMMMALWSIALPGHGLALWLTLAAWRNFIARLPFVPQKDLLFVNLAILALGHSGRDVAAILALVSAMTLVAHLSVALIGAIPGVTPSRRVAA